MNRYFATSISKEETEAHNVLYMDPASLDLDALREDPETLVIDHAGEVLFRLASEKEGV